LLDTLPRYIFQAAEQDIESGLYCMGVRYLDPIMGIFNSRDAMFEKYYWISSYNALGNNALRYLDPTGMSWDESQLTASQQEKWQSAKQASSNSELFSTMYNALDISETSYKVVIGETVNDVPGQYDRANNTITFRSEQDMVSASIYMEEIFHAYQHENLSLYESGKSFNTEFINFIICMVYRHSLRYNVVTTLSAMSPFYIFSRII